jgi:enhancer of mRNA-decapping protein 4
MNSQEANILSAMVKIIVAEVGSSVRSSFKEASADTKQGKSNNIDNKSIEAAVQRGVTSGLASGLESSLKKGVEGGLDRALADKGALSKRLERHAKESAERAAKEAVTAMQPTILNSLNQSMREVMIPAYENATRQMFQQTSKSLEQGLAQMSLNQANSIAASSSSVAPTLQAMSNQMMKMSEVIQSLSAEVAQLRAASGGNQSVNLQQQHQGRGGPPQQPLPVDIRSEIKSLCQARRYEEAFTKAVSATEGDIVLFACNNADIAAVFNNGEQPSISQPILICLMQQLGAVLVTATDARDLKVILTWLQEIAVTIDPTNVNIQRHVGSVVQQLLANINTKMSNCDPAFRRPLQTLMQVIGGVEAAARTRQQG